MSLHPHIHYLQDDLGLEDFFVVWWVVRDLLLGHKEYIDDIDLTMSWDPDTIWKVIQSKTKKEREDIFRTEKFGTMSMLHGWCKYEVTPFREESWYSDARHPDKITRSNDLLLDSGRRDFTINAMYYTKVKEVEKIEKGKEVKDDVGAISSRPQDINGSNNDELVKQLKGDWFALVENILVIQSHDIIKQLLPEGKLSISAYDVFCKNQPLDKWNISWIIWDPHQWIQDIVRGKIRCVGKSEKRFNEDALRILRAIRFQNTLNFNSILQAEFDFEKDTWMGMKKFYYLVKSLSKERVHEEIMKVFSGPNPFGYVAVLDELNILKYIFPHIIGIKKLEQPVRYHPFDVYSHSLLALFHLQSINTNYLVRLAMLYHDVGKSEQYYTHNFALDLEDRSYIYGGRLNHIRCGQDMAKEDFEKIGFSNKEIEEVAWYIGFHMKPWEILMSKEENWKKKMRELYSSVGYERVRNLLDICKWDRWGHFNPIQKSELGKVDVLYEILDDLKESEGQFTMKQLAIDGDDLIKRFDLKPWKKVGELLKIAFEDVMQDIVSRNTKDYIFEFLKEKL